MLYFAEDLKPGDEFRNERTRGYVRVTKLETTKRKGDVVRYAFGQISRAHKHEKWGQGTKRVPEFAALVHGLRRVPR
jgi:hypothetical protein